MGVYTQYDPGADMRRQDGRTSVTEERECDADDGKERETHSYVLYGLDDKDCCDPDADRRRIILSRLSRDEQYPDDESAHQGEIRDATDESELFRKDRKEKVRLRLGDRFISCSSCKPRTEYSPAAIASLLFSGW